MSLIMKACLGLLLLALPAFAENTELPLKAGDRVALSIGGILESDAAQISRVYSISDSGTINLVHVGEVKAAGLKPSALQRAVQDAYIKSEIYTRPVVNVTIDGGNTPDRMVYVVSGCRKNGPVAYNAGMTIMKAISVAGGLNEFARPKNTKLIRAGKTLELDLRNVTSDTAKDIKLEPEDQILISE
jgi:polysaccharide export outer membrane protein